MAKKNEDFLDDPFSGEVSKRLVDASTTPPLPSYNPGEKQPSVEEIIAALKSFIPEENFRKEPEASTKELIALENKYKVTTDDAINARVDLSEEVREEWLNHFDNFVLFGGDMEKINQ